MIGLKAPGVFLDSWHTASGCGEVRGKMHYWDFSEQFGPHFTDSEGEELKKQPGPRSDAFKAFLRWHTELQDEKAKLRRPARAR